MKNLLAGILLLSGLANAQVGIGTTAPQETLHVNGGARISDLTPTATSGTNVSVDANGTLTL